MRTRLFLYIQNLFPAYTHRTNSASLSRHRHAAWNSRYIRHNTGTWAPPVRLSETTPWCDQTHAPPPWRNRSWCFLLRHQTPSFRLHQSGHRHWMGKKHARVLSLKGVKHELRKVFSLSLNNYRYKKSFEILVVYHFLTDAVHALSFEVRTFVNRSLQFYISFATCLTSWETTSLSK